jgi:hypothetical protein
MNTIEAAGIAPKMSPIPPPQIAPTNNQAKEDRMHAPFAVSDVPEAHHFLMNFDAQIGQSGL